MNQELKDKTIKRLLSTKREGIEDLIKYLEEKTDYFCAPASTKFHGNYQGALLEHSNNVVDLLAEKNKKYSLNIPNDSLIIAGLLHDICKCNFYKKDVSWSKEDGKWVAYLTYSVRDEMPIGHGEKSVIIIQRYIRLTAVEVYLIRWHMNIHDCNDSNKLTLYNAIKVCPAINAMYTADLEASTFLEEVKEKIQISNEEANRIQSENRKVGA